MGLCVMQSPDPWICSNKGQSLANLIEEIHPITNNGGRNQSGDPLNLISVAQIFKDEAIFDGLMYVSRPLPCHPVLTSDLNRFISIAFAIISFVALATFPGRYKEVVPDTGSEIDINPFPSRPIIRFALACSIVASILAFVSALWQHLSSSTAKVMTHALTYGTTTGQVGKAAMVLGWGGAIWSALPVIGLAVMLMSMTVIESLMAD
jgi:hypothetical protein